MPRFRILVMLLPLFATIVVAIMVSVQVIKLGGVRKELDQVNETITFYDGLIQQAESQPLINKIPAVPPSEEEQADFLNLLRAYAYAHQVEIVSWSHRRAEDRPKKATEEEEDTTQRFISSIELEGRYPNIRSFLYSLLDSHRLFTMTDIRWTRDRGYPTVRLNMTLTRYVEGESGGSASGAVAEARR